MDTQPDHHIIDDKKLIADIKKFGWSVIMIEGTDYLPSFAYTVGLWKTFNHPEMIAFELSLKTLHAVLNTGGELIKSGHSLYPGKTYDDFFENGPAQLLTVDQRSIADYFGYATWFNESDLFPAIQLVWTDRNNLFPWESGFEKEFNKNQPLLDRNADFKFIESKTLGIFTTRQWLELNKPILQVVHDEDGDWQFLTGDQMPEDAKLVALEQMVLRDATLNEVFNLGYGEQAERTHPGGEWTRTKT